MTAPVLVLGLGNPILTDDGIGVLVAEAVRNAIPRDAAVEVEEVSVGGLALMERMVSYPRVLIVDAIVTGSVPAGTVSRLTLDDLGNIGPTRHSNSPHNASLIAALELARRAGMPLPEEVVFIAVEVENVLDFSEQQTTAVAAALPCAFRAAMAELERWGALRPAGVS